MMKKDLLASTTEELVTKLRQILWEMIGKGIFLKSPEVTIKMDSPWNKVFWWTEEWDFWWERACHVSDQEEQATERENLSEVVLLDKIFVSSLSVSSKKAKRKFPDWPTNKFPEDWDLKDVPRSENCLLWETKTILSWWKRMSSEESIPTKMEKKDKRPPKSKDLSLISD